MSYDINQDGFTQSLLVSWMKCPSRARAKLEGLYKPGFSKSIMFGSIWHQYLDVMLNRYKCNLFTHPDQARDKTFMHDVYKDVEKEFEEEYLEANGDGKDIINESYDLCNIILPHYFEYWKDDFFGDTKKEWLEVEGEFNLDLPQGSWRGKRDGVYSEKGEKFLFETKTKARWSEDTLLNVLKMDFQVYSYALAYYLEHDEYLKGVLYNIIRKPQLRKTKAESQEAFMKRIEKDVAERPDFYFCRYYAPIMPADLENFQSRFINLIDRFAEWVSAAPAMDFKNTHECVNVYGNCPYLEYCASNNKNTSLLSRREKLFAELK